MCIYMSSVCKWLTKLDTKDKDSKLGHMASLLYVTADHFCHFEAQFLFGLMQLIFLTLHNPDSSHNL